MAREVPESPRQAKAKAKENKKGRDGGMPATPARTPHTSEYAEQLKKVSFVKPSSRTVTLQLYFCLCCHRHLLNKNVTGKRAVTYHALFYHCISLLS